MIAKYIMDITVIQKGGMIKLDWNNLFCILEQEHWSRIAFLSLWMFIRDGCTNKLFITTVTPKVVLLGNPFSKFRIRTCNFSSSDVVHNIYSVMFSMKYSFSSCLVQDNLFLYFPLCLNLTSNCFIIIC